MLQISDLPQPIIRQLNGFWRRRWLIVAVAWIAALLGWFAIWLLPDQYESRAHVYVQTESILEPVLQGVVARPDYSQRVQVMRLQLLTRPNVEEIVRRARLDETIEATTALERRAQMENLIEDVAGRIKIQSPRDMYFIISFKDSSAGVAKRVTEAVMNLLIEQDLGASLAENEAARLRLDLRIEEFDERLLAHEKAIAEFRRTNADELSMSQGTVRDREQKAAELNRVRDEIEQMKRRVITLQNLLSSTPRSSSGDELDALKVQLAQLRSQYQESHPDIRGVLARIEQLESEAGGALSSNPEYVRLQTELRVARDSIVGLENREARLADEVAALELATGQAPAVEAELNRMVREYEQTQKTYDELVGRRDTLALTESLGPAGRGVEYQIFERPNEALTPTDPPRFLLILAALALAGGAGAGLAFIITLLDKSYTQEAELRDAFGLPVLGGVSETSSEIVAASRRRDFNKLALACVGLVLVGAIYTYFSVFRVSSDSESVGRSASYSLGQSL